MPFAGSGRGPWPQFIGAEGLLQRWAVIDGCSPNRSEQSLSFQNGNASSRTVRVVRYSGCSTMPVEGWFVRGWGHLPPTREAATLPIFLAAFRRPLR